MEEELQSEIAWIMDTDFLFQARLRFQKKKLESTHAGRLHQIVWPLLYDNEFIETRSQIFADAGKPGYG